MLRKRRIQSFLGIIMTAFAMTLLWVYVLNAQTTPQPVHPLNPLTESEITTAVNILKTEQFLSDTVTFPLISLKEPDKETVLTFRDGNPVERNVFAVIFEPAKNQTYEAIINLNQEKITRWQVISQGQPPFLDAEYELLETLVKADSRWQAALKKRGISDVENTVIDGWAMGLMNEAEKAQGKRLMRGITYYKDPKRMNYYGSPLEGLMVTVDLNTPKVVDVIDYGVVPFAKANFDYDEASVKPLQPAPKPIQITQPQGETFQIQGNQITWQNWTFRYLMHPREGLTFYQISYLDQGKARPVLYQAGLSEMVVPYGDPSPPWVVRSAFDIGEYRFGWSATTLAKGKDVPQNAVLLDVLFADDEGNPTVSEDIIGIYEQDAGILWRHYDSNTETYEGRRSRELVVTSVAAIGNYDYGINWVFHEDGTLEVQTDLTGIMLVKGTDAQTETHDSFGHLVAPNVLAVNHQHFINFRLDFDVDGLKNRISEMNVSALPLSDSNPQGNAFKMEKTPLVRESEAVRDLNLAQSRTWLIENDSQNNELGAKTGYMLMPGSNTVFYPLPESNVYQRGEFATHHLWVTQFKPHEYYAGGDYPNQGLPHQGLPQWIADNESLEGEDLVVWYTLGVTHIPRPEEWPIMTIHRASFKLTPRGFFAKNPVLNVPNL